MGNRGYQSISWRYMDYQRNVHGNDFGRSEVSQWQGCGYGGGFANLMELSWGSSEGPQALAYQSNFIYQKQQCQYSLLEMPYTWDFGGADMGYSQGYGPSWTGNQDNFRRAGTYNRAGVRGNLNYKSKPHFKASRKGGKNNAVSGNLSKNLAVRGKSSTKKEAPKTKYDDINPQLLKCHICYKKIILTARSFESHVNGRGHAIMMRRTARGYARTAHIMREAYKFREMKRIRKAGQRPSRNFYCVMCDMHAADGALHRTSVGHRQLKKYIHPRCMSCRKSMSTRIELDRHLLTAEHLRNKQEIITKPKPVLAISTINMEQFQFSEDTQHCLRPDDIQTTDMILYDEDTIMKDVEGDRQDEETTNEGHGETKPETEEKSPVDQENTILDYKEGDDLQGITPDMFPAYSSERDVGGSFLYEYDCVLRCSLCCEMLYGRKAAQEHLRTWRHHQLFTRLLAEKTGIQLGSKSKKRPLEFEDYNEAKRRKTDDGGQPNGQAINAVSTISG